MEEDKAAPTASLRVCVSSLHENGASGSCLPSWILHIHHWLNMSFTSSLVGTPTMLTVMPIKHCFAETLSSFIYLFKYLKGPEAIT